MKLQEYLNNKYPTKEEKEKVKEINIDKINIEEKGNKDTQWLEGGELDLSEYVNVEKINVYGHHLKTFLTKLTLGEKPKLTELYYPSNQLTTIDVSKCPNLTYFCCFSNQLTTIDVTKCPGLKSLYCRNNPIKETIDLTKCLSLCAVNVPLSDLRLGNWDLEIDRLQDKLTRIEQQKAQVDKQNQSLKTEKERLERELAENKQVIREKLDESFIVIAPKS